MLAPGGASAYGSTTYVSGATVVVKQAGSAPVADDGAVLCTGTSVTGGPGGVGGGCIPFGQPLERPAILVQDAVSGTRVAFQVCIDNNGDGACTVPHGDPGQTDPCGDIIGFSHDDQGMFWNPLGFYKDGFGALVPLPTTRPASCPQGGFHGYVVFLCEGVHATADPHAHAATTGTIASVPLSPVGPFGAGDFCQTIRDPIIKSYFT
jgi:hypothetical protein